MTKWSNGRQWQSTKKKRSQSWSPDIDAVRHLNQFGSPENPLMEVACTPEKVDLVRSFFKESEIELRPVNLNPLFEPDTPTIDPSTAAISRHINHLTRVLTAWWKAAHYVQNRDTEAYNSTIKGKVVQSPTILYTWPAQVTGIIIDARGITEAKENPKLYLEYEHGYETLAKTQKKGKQIVAARSFATGGSEPAKQATKRFRAEGPPQTEEKQEGEREDHRLITVDDIRTPAAITKKQPALSLTPNNQVTKSAQAGPSTAVNPL